MMVTLSKQTKSGATRGRKAALIALLGVVLLHLPCLAATPLELAIKAYHAGKYDEAIGRFGQAETTDFNNPKLHYYLANALAKKNQTKDAIKEYKIALAMEPEGQLAGYCRQALTALGAMTEEPHKRKKKVSLPELMMEGASDGSEPPLASTGGIPKIISVQCGCPQCQRLQLILTDLQTKYGSRISFAKTTTDTTEPKFYTILSRYNVTTCPEVLFFQGDGRFLGRARGKGIPETLLYKSAELLLKDTAKNMPPPVDDNRRNTNIAQNIAQEAEARISQDQKRLDTQINHIRDELKNNMANYYYGRRFNSSGYMQDSQDAEKRIQSLRDDFERRKKEVRAAAKARIDSLSPNSASIYDYLPAQQDANNNVRKK